MDAYMNVMHQQRNDWENSHTQKYKEHSSFSPSPSILHRVRPGWRHAEMGGGGASCQAVRYHWVNQGPFFSQRTHFLSKHFFKKRTKMSHLGFIVNISDAPHIWGRQIFSVQRSCVWFIDVYPAMLDSWDRLADAPRGWLIMPARPFIVRPLRDLSSGPDWNSWQIHDSEICRVYQWISYSVISVPCLGRSVWAECCAEPGTLAQLGFLWERYDGRQVLSNLLSGPKQGPGGDMATELAAQSCCQATRVHRTGL